MNKKHILIVGIGFFLMATICFMEYNQNPSNSFNINSGKDGDNDVLRENYLKIAATANYILDFNTTWGGSNYDYANGIAVDGAGNIYITGRTSSFGAGQDDAFITKYDSTGTSLLNITWGGSYSDSGNDIVVDGAGNIYITGYTSSFGAGYYDAFIAKYDSAGTSLLNITWGGSNGDFANDIVVDGAGNIYITGSTYSFGAGQYEAFIAKYDSAGTSLLNITRDGSDGDSGHDIALDGAGNIYVTGSTYSFGTGDSDAFIAKYDSAGTSLLNITWGGSNYDAAYGIAVDGAGNIYITGKTSSFGAGDSDAFIAKYDSAGTSLLNITWGGSNGDSGNGIAVDGSGNIYITGGFNRFVEGSEDAFIAKYDSAGTSLLNITWAGSNDDSGSGIAVDGSGNIYITGYTYRFGEGDSNAFIAKYNLTIDDSTDAGIPGPTILLIGIISALSIGMILKRLFQTNKLRRI
jgi:uncharacterized delta-60 repeat protein